jgi:macrodomain Ter protein organizer (MatP/YcbG family)
MPKRVEIHLSGTQQAELVEIRNHHAKPYMRERAAAILKVDNGELLTQVAEEGLLKRHEPETVHEWIKNYLQRGVKGLSIKAGRGRKARFFPSLEGGSRSGSS